MDQEKKRVVTACCLFIIVLLSGQQQQVAAISKFCRCYQNCYAECRKSMGTYPCNVECFQDCINGQPPPSHPSSPANCNKICLQGICGVIMETAMAAAPGDAEACVANCTNKLRAFAPTAAKFNY